MPRFRVGELVSFTHGGVIYKARIVDIEDHRPINETPRYGLIILGQSPFIIPTPYLWEYEILGEQPCKSESK